MKYEVFNPYIGTPIISTRYKRVAKLLAHLLNLDYAEAGAAW